MKGAWDSPKECFYGQRSEVVFKKFKRLWIDGSESECRIDAEATIRSDLAHAHKYKDPNETAINMFDTKKTKSQ